MGFGGAIRQEPQQPSRSLRTPLALQGPVSDILKGARPLAHTIADESLDDGSAVDKYHHHRGHGSIEMAVRPDRDDWSLRSEPESLLPRACAGTSNDAFECKQLGLRGEGGSVEGEKRYSEKQRSEIDRGEGNGRLSH
jgi:hypothetical protein